MQITSFIAASAHTDGASGAKEGPDGRQGDGQFFQNILKRAGGGITLDPKLDLALRRIEAGGNSVDFRGLLSKGAGVLQRSIELAKTPSKQREAAIRLGADLAASLHILETHGHLAELKAISDLALARMTDAPEHMPSEQGALKARQRLESILFYIPTLQRLALVTKAARSTGGDVESRLTQAQLQTARKALNIE